MHTIQLVLIVISGLFITHARPVEEDVERQQRVLLHSDGDLMDVLAKTQAMVATLNSTLNNLLVTTKAEIGTMNSTIHLQNGKYMIRYNDITNLF